MDTQNTARRLIVFLSICTILCSTVGGVAWRLQPPQFSTRKDAIVYTLEQRGYKVEELIIERGWPDTVNYQVYGAALQVQVQGQAMLPGRIECRDLEHSCWINIAQLDIIRVPIPDVTRSREPEILVWIRNLVNKLKP